MPVIKILVWYLLEKKHLHNKDSITLNVFWMIRFLLKYTRECELYRSNVQENSIVDSVRMFSAHF